MEDHIGLFGTYKQCEFCNRPLPIKYEFDLCPRCQENKLFEDVREYIRGNDVNEFEVATHFGISVRKVRDWIREGRIEYKAKDEETQKILANLRCEICGAPVQFGVLCTKCSRNLHAKKGYGAFSIPNNEESRMRFIDHNNQ